MDYIKNIIKSLSTEQRVLLSLMVFDIIIIILSSFH